MQVKALLSALLIGIGLTTGSAYSQEWPQEKTITLIVPFDAGGATDVAARLLADGLSEQLGQTVVVENRPGGGQNIGADMVAKADPDGYTLLVTAPGPLAINKYLYPKLEYDPAMDFTPISLLKSDPLVFVVNSSSEASSLEQFLQMARENPGKLTYGSSGSGATSHMMSAVLFAKAGVDVLHIPYKGGSSAAEALLAKEVDFIASNPTSALPFIQSGDFRALAVSAAAGSSALPDVPPADKAGLPGYDYTTWLGLVGPAGLPENIVDQLYAATKKALGSPKFVEKMMSLASDVVGSGPDEFSQFIEGEQAKWKDAVEAADAKAE